MTGAYRVDLVELLASVEQLVTFESRLLSAIEAADREVNRLHASWSGAAADEHRLAHERWRRATSDMHTALTTMRRIAHGAHGNYTAAATANTTMWRF